MTLNWKELEGEPLSGGDPYEDGYVLERLLGCGGYGAVYSVGEHIYGNRMGAVAVRLIPAPADDDPEKRKKQIKKLYHAANLKHPNLVGFDVSPSCCISRCVCLLMELNDTLQGQLKRGSLSVAQVQEIVEAIASALVYLHKEPERLVHRNLKPSNVLRSYKSWQLADFGLISAIIDDDGFHHTVELKGTREYVPPEAYQTKDITTAWDVWSLGVMIVEMLTGKLPFTGETAALLMNQVINDPPSIDWSKVPAPFVEIIEGCLEKDRKKRWTAQMVIDRLAGKPLPAPPPVTSTFTFETVTVNQYGNIIQLTKKARHFTEDLGNGVTLDMVYIPGGSFAMGSPDNTPTSSHHQTLFHG
jgi:serine/threonine protein kinase